MPAPSEVPALRLLVYAHLLWTGVLTGLALVLNLRFPYPETSRWFHITLALLVATALAPLTLFWLGPRIIWLPPLTFGIATLAFAVFGVVVIRTHLQHLRRRR